MMPRIRKINKHYTKEKETHIMVRVMVFNATFNNISVISWRYDFVSSNANDWSKNIPGIMIVSTYATRAYHHWCCEFESSSVWGVQNYVINFVSDLRSMSNKRKVSIYHRLEYVKQEKGKYLPQTWACQTREKVSIYHILEHVIEEKGKYLPQTSLSLVWHAQVCGKYLPFSCLTCSSLW
jgi:hypothetical protein